MLASSLFSSICSTTALISSQVQHTAAFVQEGVADTLAWCPCLGLKAVLAVFLEHQLEQQHATRFCTASQSALLGDCKAYLPPCGSTIFLSPPRSISVSTVSLWFISAAHIKAVLPNLSFWLMSKSMVRSTILQSNPCGLCTLANRLLRVDRA